MKQLGGFLVFGMWLVSLIVPASSVAAQTPQYNNQIHVSGIVLPAQHVIIDEKGIVLEILSNTRKDIMPTVYLGSLAAENIIPMTPEIYEQYRQIVPEGQSKIGTLYKREPGSSAYQPIESLIRANTDNDAYTLPASFSH